MDSRQKIDAMLQTIGVECRYTQGLTGRSVLQPEVMEAMSLVSRQEFGFFRIKRTSIKKE